LETASGANEVIVRLVEPSEAGLGHCKKGMKVDSIFGGDKKGNYKQKEKYVNFVCVLYKLLKNSKSSRMCRDIIFNL